MQDPAELIESTQPESTIESLLKNLIYLEKARFERNRWLKAESEPEA